MSRCSSSLRVGCNPIRSPGTIMPRLMTARLFADEGGFAMDPIHYDALGALPSADDNGGECHTADSHDKRAGCDDNGYLLGLVLGSRVGNDQGRSHGRSPRG